MHLLTRTQTLIRPFTNEGSIARALVEVTVGTHYTSGKVGYGELLQFNNR